MVPRQPRSQPTAAIAGDHSPIAVQRDVFAFYAVQLHLLLRWSGGRAALIRRGLMTAAVSILAFVATIVLIPDFDHVCCWQKLWPSIIADLARGTE